MAFLKEKNKCGHDATVREPNLAASHSVAHVAKGKQPDIVALHAGVPARVRTHDVTKQVEYIGDVQNLVEKLSDLPAGGQVLMGPLTYQRIYSRLEEFRIHSLQKSYEQPARSHLPPLSAMLLTT